MQSDPRPAYAEASLFLLVFGLLPNAVFFLLGQFIFLARPLVDVDYLLVGVLWPWVPVWLGTAGFAVALALDFVMSTAPIFHFKTVSLMQSILDAFHLDPAYGGLAFGLIVLAIAGISFAVAWAVRHSRRLWQLSGVMLFAAAATFALDVMLSANAFRANDNQTLATNIATSALFNISRAVRATLSSQSTMPIVHDVPSATLPVFRALGDGSRLPNRVVVVVVESLGEFVEPAANKLQFAALENADLARRYRIEKGNVEFAGSTVPGELRELCRIRLIVTHPDPAQLPVAQCLPAMLRKRGYRSIAAHGFSGSLFDRSRWYPALGFDESLFIQDIDRILGRKSRCGVSFPGACDTDVVSLLSRRLFEQADHRIFAYWMTLNAHLPVYAPPGSSAIACESSRATTDAAQCNLVRHHDMVMAAIRDLALSPDLPPTLFVIVGDHMPPFFSKGQRNLYDQQHVPYAVLYPREGGLQPRGSPSAPSS
jgi:hypothetical protein